MNITEQAERLANTYADTILRLSYTYLKNTDDAQDICQTVFVKLLTEAFADLFSYKQITKLG